MNISKVFTFVIYMSTILVSTYFVYCAENSLKREKRSLYIFFSFLALFVPSMLAGIRSDAVGVDVRTYSVPWFNMAKSYSNFLSYDNAQNA